MAEHMYDRTRPGSVEVKRLPPAVVFESESPRPIDEARDRLFLRNFSHLQAHDLKMTTPVEVDPAPARMRFYYPRMRTDEQPETDEPVRRVELPPRTVVSAGVRGGYGDRGFRKGLVRAERWLREHPEWRPAGGAYAVYWDGPIVPAPFRRMEVHVPVEHAGEGPQEFGVSTVPYSP